ncbi:MAG: YihY/virulence factor BrkB family protein [Candidatus Acidiferrales bacterium]
MASHTAPTVWRLGGLRARTLARNVWNEMNDDDVWGHAAELSYYWLLAIFPLLIFLLALFGLMASEGTQFRAALFEHVDRLAPPDASGLIQQTVDQVSDRASGGLLSFGILMALLMASEGTRAMITTLNQVYEVHERRPWWKQRLVAIALTFLLAVMITVGLAGVVLGGPFADWVGRVTRLGDWISITWQVARWPLAILFAMLGFGAVFYWGPNFREHRWYWVTPGAITAVVLWLAASIGFNVYLSYFNYYGATYGSLGAVIILLFWLYLTGVALLTGGEINAEIEAAAAKRRRLAASHD